MILISCHERPGCVILSDMKTIHAHLRLSTNLNGSTRERCPDVVFTSGDAEIAAIRTDDTQPQLLLEDGCVDELVLHDDALSRSIDEEAWLREFARVIIPGGIIRFTVPAEGRFAWLDTMNAYRYFADISGRGHAPDAANPTGWNRHYTRAHIERLANHVGFGSIVIRAQNHALQELGLLTGLLRDNWIRQDRQAELRLFPRFGHRDPGNHTSIVLTTWSVSARRRP